MTQQMRSTVSSSAILVLSLVSGCGGPAGIAGTVTYEGKPIERGHITFFPTESAGNTHGANIVDGQFYLARRTIGKVRILVTAHPRVEVQSANGNGPKVKLLPHDNVPANAIGNNQLVEITADVQTLTIELRKPAP